MFICNFKIDTKKIWKVTLVILIILIVSLMIFVLSKIFNPTKNSSDSKENDVVEITTDSYTAFLKDCHENINDYIGKNFKITGYVYRLPDFTSRQIVIARTMIIEENQAVIVGMLSECSSAEKYDTGSWIEVTGEIKKGNYNGEIPILEISNIKTIKAPNNEFVYMPENN